MKRWAVINMAVAYVSWLLDDHTDRKLTIKRDEPGIIRFRLPGPRREEQADVYAARISQKFGPNKGGCNFSTGWILTWWPTKTRAVHLEWENGVGSSVTLVDHRYLK